MAPCVSLGKVLAPRSLVHVVLDIELPLLHFLGAPRRHVVVDRERGIDHVSAGVERALEVDIEHAHNASEEFAVGLEAVGGGDRLRGRVVNYVQGVLERVQLTWVHGK